IDEGLKASDIVIGLMTPESVASRNVKNEWDWALANHKRLVLLMLRPCDVPHRYISINYLDWTDGQKQTADQLRHALDTPHHEMYKSEALPVTKAPRLKVSSADKRNRARMLEKVSIFWVKGVLENSLHGAALLELGMERRPGTVETPWD